jgi:hypothetical protein
MGDLRVHENRRRFEESGKFFSPQYPWTLVNLTRSSCGRRVATTRHMKRDLTLWATGVLAAVLFLGSVGAFLLYVPALALAVVMTTLVGLLLMFVLGFQSGRGDNRISRARKASPSELNNGVRTAKEGRARFAVFPQAARRDRCFQ